MEEEQAIEQPIQVDLAPPPPDRDVWIAAINRGHNATVILMKNHEILFAIEEERLTRRKYDGAPLAGMLKILDYTDKLDYLVIVHTQDIDRTAGKLDFCGEDAYTGMARKLHLIDDRVSGYEHPQVIEISDRHHKMHAACAFYRSGFDEAVALIADGAGSELPYTCDLKGPTSIWEYESIIECNYPAVFRTKYKHLGGTTTLFPAHHKDADAGFLGEENNKIEIMCDDRGGVTKVYEAVTQYLGWQPIEAGKTMGLFPYGIDDPNMPPLFDEYAPNPGSFNRNVFTPNTPNGAFINARLYDSLSSDREKIEEVEGDITKLDVGRSLAYKCQIETQREMVKLIKKAVEMTGKTNVVISGGYALNCVANYEYLDALKDEGINIYVEPISSDAGTAIGGALSFYHSLFNDTDKKFGPVKDLYLGFDYKYTTEDIEKAVEGVEKYEILDYDNDGVVDLLTEKNIVTIFQGRSENGPRALGNRSILFDPTFVDGKDYVNSVKNREYFRPFAGSILQDDVHDWFDLRGMEDSPFMMYAVNCKDGIAEKIPSIIHVDGTCRIQTVTEEVNPNYYNLIKAFKKKTGVPIIFNTSFNLGGEPLVETIEDAIRTLVNSDLEYLYLPEIQKMVYVPNDVA
jgi:carbamoyltransferase